MSMICDICFMNGSSDEAAILFQTANQRHLCSNCVDKASDALAKIRAKKSSQSNVDQPGVDKP